GGFTFYKDFWRYAPTSNTWTNKPDFPGYTRAWAMGFSLNGLGYIGLGRDENQRSNTGKIYRYYP
ncbi:MAG: galactose oxidase, partial [Chitinophagaceae bacterium]|nr:galactose oxidase [Chitinophagaceae bacterium]